MGSQPSRALVVSIAVLLAGCSDFTESEGGATSSTGGETQADDATDAGPTTNPGPTSGSTEGTDTHADTTAAADSDDGEETTGDGSGDSTGGEAMCPQTRLPGSIAGVEPESHSHHPPIVDGNGNLYRMTETPSADGNSPQMLKSTDGGATWSEVDGGNRPDATDLEGTYQLQVGTTVYFSVTRGQRAWWFGFNTSDAAEDPDTWSAAEMFDDDLTSGGVKQASSLAQTSDEQFWLAYSDLVIDDRQQIALRRRTGSNTYDEKITIDETSGSWTGPRLALGRDDITHLFYNDALNSRLYWRTIAPDGTVSERTQIDTNSPSDVAIPHTHTVIYERGNAEVMVTGFVGADDRLKVVTIEDGVVGPEESVSDDPILQDADVVANEGAVAHLTLHDTTVHAVWTDEGSGDILLRSKPDRGDWGEIQTLWSSEDEEALYVYCTVLTSGNCPRLGCTYDIGPHEDDTGNIEYNEFVLPE